MLSQSFFLIGEAQDSAQIITTREETSFEDLQDLIASHFAIVVPGGALYFTANISI